MRIVLTTLLLSSVVVLGGCTVLQEDGGRDFNATLPAEDQAPATTPGAIYAQGTEVSLWENVTARNVGDTLTIRLEESTNAEKSVSTNTNKASEAELAGPTVFGRPVTVNGTPILEGSMNTESSFNGNGASKQSNALDGALSVTVAKRFANGNLLVRGQKWISINQGQEYVRIQGIVRPIDIDPDNSISSLKVADAMIAYGGKGALANANSPGILSRFFNLPFLPF